MKDATHDEMFSRTARGGGKSSVLRAHLKAHPEAILFKPTGKPVGNVDIHSNWAKRHYEAEAKRAV